MNLTEKSMMNIYSLAAPQVLAPLHGLWRWISHGPITQYPLSATALNAHHAFTPNPPSAAKCHLGQSQPALTTLAPRKPLRVIRVLEKDHVPATVGRMVISGRMADVCAELDRLADREAALH